MNIKSNIKDYKLIIEKSLDFLKEICEIQNAEYVIDKNVYELYGRFFATVPVERLIIIEATESNKVIETALDICEKITEISAKRNSVLVSIGGGIIQDITGFVANITYRGINWIYVPTTLLSACDSCIGGKTSLNYKKYKNLLGTFYPPSEIHICPDFFKTLSDKDFKSGLGEVVKFNIMKGIDGLAGIESDIKELLEREADVVARYVNTSLEFKKSFIEIDEFDKGERVKLNFAHTFGHAIEVVTEYVIPHGTAVAIGMIMANRVSVKRNLLNGEIAKRSEEVLLKVIDVDADLLDSKMDTFISAMKKDKKQTSDNLTAVLIGSYGDVANLIVVNDISINEVNDAVEYFRNIYTNS